MSPYTRSLIWVNLHAIWKEQALHVGADLRGWACICLGAFSLHLLIRPEYRRWGRDHEEYEGRLLCWCLGPLAALSWAECVAWDIVDMEDQP